MKHAPASLKGQTRRWVVRAIEIALGASFVYGALYLFCLGVHWLLCAGVG